MSGSELESRYRRLLAWYPRSHRQVYEEEMLAVLVAGARPDQRRPTMGEAVNLVASGLAARGRAAFGGPVSPAWADAAAVFGLLAALVLLSQRVIRLSQSVAPDSNEPSSLTLYLQAIGWGAVVLAALVGLRRAAAVLAWVAVLGQAVLLARYYGIDPVSTVDLFWPFALGVVAAAALTVPAPPQHAVSVLRGPRLLAFVLGIGAIQAILVASRLGRAPMYGDGGGTIYVFYGLENESELVLHLWLAGIVAGAVAAGLAALTLPSAVRWRIAVLATPVAALAGFVELTLDGWAYSNMLVQGTVYLAPVQWALLIAVPLVAFGLGAAAVRWRDERARLVARGRAAETLP